MTWELGVEESVILYLTHSIFIFIKTESSVRLEIHYMQQNASKIFGT